MSARCTCGETACESELCDCDKAPCPVDHAAEHFRDEVLREAAEKIRAFAWGKFQGFDDATAATAQAVADLIDPDKENT